MKWLWLAFVLIHTIGHANDRAALLAAIVANPGEDTPRLAYADWLEENGAIERAKFIRIQIKIARGHYEPHELEGLREQEKDLLKHANQWLPRDFHKHLDGFITYTGRLDWERGFPRRLEVRTTVLDYPTACNALNGLEGVAYLAFHGPFTPPQVQTLRHLDILRRTGGLGLSASDIGDAELISILPAMKHMRKLTINGAHLSADGIAALAESEFAKNAVALSFFEAITNSSQQRSLEVLAGSPNLKKLKGLTLMAHEMHSLAPLLRGNKLESLTELVLAGVFSAEELAAFCASPTVKGLTRLGIHSRAAVPANTAERAFAALLAADVQLRHLSLGGYDIPLPLQQRIDHNQQAFHCKETLELFSAL